jgi:hypothetical protein
MDFHHSPYGIRHHLESTRVPRSRPDGSQATPVRFSHVDDSVFNRSRYLMERMVNVLATVAAVFVVVLFAVALLALAAGEFAVAGVVFLSASIVIYFREKRLVDS